ncbi:MAG: DMT family transporter [Pseudomonadota bacterium]
MSTRKTHIDLAGASLLIGFSVLLGLNQALVKIVNAGFSPVFQSGLRSVCALLPVFLYALLSRKKMSVTDGTLPWGVLNGLLFSFEFCLLFLALDYTTVARVSLFFYIMPVWVAIGAHFLIPEESLNRNKIGGLGLALAGVLLAFSGDLGSAGDKAWIGDLLALLGGMFWAGIALVSRVSPLANTSPEMNLLYQLLVSAILLTLIAPLFGPVIREPTLTIGLVFAFQVIFVVCIGFLVWFWILSIYPVSNMASFGLLTPVFGVFFGWLLFDDPLTTTFVLSIGLAGAGIVLVNTPVKRSAPST